MNYVLDTHSHTLASGHAYSTINEMAFVAADKGLKIIAITEHGPNMPGTCHEFYFHNLKVVTRNMYGVELLLGSEVNILDYDGNVDLDNLTLKSLDIVIASLHPPCIEAGTKEQNTAAIINAMKNPFIDIIGHPDDSRFPLDYESIVLASKVNNVLLEVNNSSLSPTGFRKNARENILELLTMCKKHNVTICLGSDAHVANDIGNYQYSKELLDIVDFPEELVVNGSVDRLKAFLNDRKERF